MVINKIQTKQLQEESSSLTNQKKYLRRPDLTVMMRLFFAISGLGRHYRKCTIAELSRSYKVSHTFIYNQTKILINNSPELFGSKMLAEETKLEALLSAIRFYLEGKLETKSPLEGLCNFATSLGVKYTSSNFVSQLLEVSGILVGSTYCSPRPLLLTFLCDEVYSGGQAILVTVDAQSMFVLDIRLVEDSLTSADWEASFNRQADNQVLPKRLIKDGGLQMQSATKVLSSETIIGADTFHAIPHRLGVFHGRLERQVQSAQEKEAKRALCFCNTKTYKTALKKEAEWQAATYKTVAAIDQLTWFKEHYFLLLNQLRPFTSKGVPRDKNKAEGIIKESLEALALMELPNLQKHLDHIALLLENGQLLHFMDQVPSLHQELQSVIEPVTSWVWMLYWQWTKKSYQTHSPKVQQRAKQEALAAKELLIEYYEPASQQEVAQSGQASLFSQLQEKVFKSLDEIVQASSLVEAFNSILKPFINSTRGQVSQSLLNLVKFHHNNTIFKRGKRQGAAPIELLTGQPLEKSWIDLLMDKVEAAFKEHNTTSLKKLHQLICPKKKLDNKVDSQIFSIRLKEKAA